MTDRELLESIAARMGILENKMDSMETKIDNMENRMDSMETKMDSMEIKIDNMENRMDSMQGQMDTMQEDIKVLKHTSALVETDIAPKVQLLLENHTDLAKNVMVAKDIEERVGVLEFDVKIIKRLLETKAGA